LTVPRHPIVLFDLDGTLTDAQAGIVRSLAHAVAAVGVAAPGPEELRPLIGPPLVEMLLALGVPEDDLRSAVHAYRDRYATVGLFENELYPGVPELLADLTGAGLRLGLATSKAEPYAHTILEHFGIRGRFEAVAGASLDHARRHKADVVAHALEHLGLPDPASVIMVGDREHDVVGAAEHGITTIGVLWGYGSRAELTTAGAVAVVSSVEGLGALLLGRP
jgi:phosphoglycolate phosphatase